MLKLIPRLCWATWGTGTSENVFLHLLGLPLPGGLTSYLPSHPLPVPPALHLGFVPGTPKHPSLQHPHCLPLLPRHQDLSHGCFCTHWDCHQRGHHPPCTPAALQRDLWDISPPCSCSGCRDHAGRSSSSSCLHELRENHMLACVREHMCVHWGWISWALKI